MEKSFDVSLTGVCVSSFHVLIRDGYIEDVQFNGGCKFDLRTLRENLIGEPVSSAYLAVLANCCPDKKKPCVSHLKFRLLEEFRKIAEDYLN